jgi:hypothetical protein
LTEYLNTDINHNRTIDMNGLRYFKAVVFVACFSAIAPATLTAQDPPASETAKLVAVLNSADASIFDKAKACQRLALVGDESAVPALAGLLTDEKLSAYAREALEGIPAAACDAALREALTRLEGERLIGVLGSIGARRDVEAIDAVGEMLSSDDQSHGGRGCPRAGAYWNARDGRHLAENAFRRHTRIRSGAGQSLFDLRPETHQAERDGQGGGLVRCPAKRPGSATRQVGRNP